ncbi:MAG: hypothetical protein M3142_01515 [Bacteroidota bacterium]|nr:hypothetical protein [Bacteroidota bacterium]
MVNTMLTLQNFETQINPTILQRGKTYYNQKTISWLEETKENQWQAEVEGSATYQVQVTLQNKNNIIEYSCGCPYDDWHLQTHCGRFLCSTA